MLKALKDHIEQNFNFKVQSTGVIYFSDGTVNIIQGSEERDKYVDTVSTKSSLRRIISEAIELSKHPLNKEQVDQITAIFKIKGIIIHYARYALWLLCL